MENQIIPENFLWGGALQPISWRAAMTGKAKVFRLQM